MRVETMKRDGIFRGRSRSTGSALAQGSGSPGLQGLGG